MSKYNSINGELVLINFYNRLIKRINYYNQSIYEFFRTQKGKIGVELFHEQLKLLGYTQQEINEINYISNYFSCDPSTQSLINIDEIKNKLDKYQRQQTIKNSSNDYLFISDMDKKIINEINLVKSKMEKEILNFPPYIMVKLCYQIKNNLFLNQLTIDYLLKAFEEKDHNKFGFVDKDYFFEVINLFYTSNENEKNIIINKLNDNPHANKKNIPYQTFCQLINKVDKNEINDVIHKFNIKNNPYIVNMRNYIINNGIKVRDKWAIINQEKANISKYEFINFLKKGNLIDPNNLLNDKEIEYIFNILSSNQQQLNFLEFEKAIKEKEFNIMTKKNIRINVDQIVNTTRNSNIDNQNFNGFYTVNNTQRNNMINNFRIQKSEKNKIKQPEINIKKLCEFIINIIINEKKQNIQEYFKNADKFNKGFITINKLKNLFKNDLKIKIDEDNSIKGFFDMIKENETFEGNEIVKIEHIIQVFRTYCEKEKEKLTNQTNINNNEVFNIEKLETLKNIIKDKEKIISNLENEISSKNLKINELEKKISKLENEKSEKEKNNFDIAKINEKLKEKENECIKLKELIININLDNNNLKTKYKNLKIQYESLKKEHNEINRNYTIMCKEYKEKKRK